MDTVVSEENKQTFISNKIYSVLPRGERAADYSIDKKTFYSYGLEEFEELFIKKDFREELQSYLYSNPGDLKIYSLIDIANGHLERLYNLAKLAKKRYGEHLVLMIGNVANPDTFREYCKIGVDYVRLGIGNGAGCTTSANVAVGYPIGSLILECSFIQEEEKSKTKIVSDGGCKNISDIIKCLFLGADYVMCGSIFNKALESAGQLYLDGYDNSLDILEKDYIENKDFYLTQSLESFDSYIKNIISQKRFTKLYRGMSTKEVQKKWGREVLKTAEGISKKNIVEYTLAQWCENFEDYLRSTMSYTNSRVLEDCKNSQIEMITNNAFKRFNK